MRSPMSRRRALQAAAIAGCTVVMRNVVTASPATGFAPGSLASHRSRFDDADSWATLFARYGGELGGSLAGRRG